MYYTIRQFRHETGFIKEEKTWEKEKSEKALEKEKSDNAWQEASLEKLLWRGQV